MRSHGRGAACESRYSAIHPENRQCRFEGPACRSQAAHTRPGVNLSPDRRRRLDFAFDFAFEFVAASFSWAPLNLLLIV
jgi:hypothetical protein